MTSAWLPAARHRALHRPRTSTYTARTYFDSRGQRPSRTGDPAGHGRRVRRGNLRGRHQPAGEAIALAQRWAAQHGIRLQIQFTLPVEPDGLGPAGLSVLQNAIADGIQVSSVNIMVFDYYLPHEGVMNMSQTAITSANAVHAELARLYPQLSSRQIWHMEAMTMLPGISDFGKDETTTIHDAQVMLAFEQKMQMNLLSIWAIQRDTEGPMSCLGQPDSNTCSGIKQAPWAFDHVLAPFTQRFRW